MSWIDDLVGWFTQPSNNNNNSWVGDGGYVFDGTSTYGNSNPGGSSSKSSYSDEYRNNDYLAPEYNPGGYWDAYTPSTPSEPEPEEVWTPDYGYASSNYSKSDSLDQNKFGGNDSGKEGIGQEDFFVGDNGQIFQVNSQREARDEERQKQEDDEQALVLGTNAVDQAKQEVAPWEFMQAVTDFMNSDNAYAQAYRNQNNIDTFDWYNDYGKMASEGGRDIWANMITSDDNFKNAYKEDYGNSIDFDEDGVITLDEANRWYDNMKAENYIEGGLDFTSDDEIMQRIFGGLAGNGANNDLVDAINMNQTMALYNLLSQGISLADIVNSGKLELSGADDTGKTYAEALGLEKLVSGGGSADDIMAAIARINNSNKLDRLISAAGRNADSGEKKSVIDFGDDQQTAAAINSLLSNVAGVSSGLSLSNGNELVNEGDTIYNVRTAVPTTEQSSDRATALANSLVNSGGKDVSDELAYLLLNNLGTNGQSLADQGYSVYRTDGSTVKGNTVYNAPVEGQDYYIGENGSIIWSNPNYQAYTPGEAMTMNEARIQPYARGMSGSGRDFDTASDTLSNSYIGGFNGPLSLSTPLYTGGNYNGPLSNWGGLLDEITKGKK